jgi:hypothetical protein
MIALPEFAKKRSEFIASTVGQANGVFWARFRDGRFFVYFHNFPKRPWEAEQESEALDLTEGDRALVLTANTSDFASHAPTATRITQMLRQSGYATTKGTATVESMLAVKGGKPISFLYLHTYGGVVEGIIGSYALYTSTVATAAADTTYKSKLDTEEMVYTAAYDGTPPSQTTLKYGIASNFITRSMNFRDKSIVFLHAGPIGNTSGGASIRASFMLDGADVVLAFKGPTSADSYANVEYLFDRWSGANLVEKVTPAQRPFSLAGVEARLKELGRNKDPKTGALLGIFRASGSTTELLRPTIQYMEYLPDNELWIKGQFGDNGTPDPQKVTIGGVAKQILSWNPTLIRVKLTDAVTGNSGPVQVWVGTKKSNVRQLTQWRGSVTTDIKIGKVLKTYPAQRQVITNTLTLRGDAYEMRIKPDGPLVNTNARFSATNASKAAFAVTGFVEQDNKPVRVWFGDGAFLHRKKLLGDPGPMEFTAIGVIDSIKHRLALELYPGLDLVATFKLGSFTSKSSLGLVNISLFDTAPPVLRYFLNWTATHQISAKTKPRWVAPDDTYNEVKWTAFSATPAFSDLNPR